MHYLRRMCLRSPYRARAGVRDRNYSVRSTRPVADYPTDRSMCTLHHDEHAGANHHDAGAVHEHDVPISVVPFAVQQRARNVDAHQPTVPEWLHMQHSGHFRE